ncbi:hypothetical protein ABLV66_05150 [Klebsiella sp. CN_Kp073]|uniref:hypothetical protein n=1 Tax=Klebsiella sp. CN_Kp073 TaxID=3153412 RepID=UPI0032B4B01D
MAIRIKSLRISYAQYEKILRLYFVSLADILLPCAGVVFCEKGTGTVDKTRGYWNAVSFFDFGSAKIFCVNSKMAGDYRTIITDSRKKPL